VIRDLVVQQALVVLLYVGLVVITQEDPHLELFHEVIDPRDMEIVVLDLHAEGVVGGLKLRKIVPKIRQDCPFIGRSLEVKLLIVKF
jgi:hypothetical protein